MTKNQDDELNPEQKKAVRQTQGPLLIVAGAGTGKTKVIVEKIKYLLHKKLARPEEILALTFTEKAAYEMQERVDQAVPYGYFQMWISTFHGFADQLLQEYSYYIGINRRFKLMTQAEAILFFRKNLFLFDLNYFRPLGNPQKFIEDLLKHFDRLKDEKISPQEYEKWAGQTLLEKEEREKYLELAQAYKKYQDLKIQSGNLDFSDLVYYLVTILEKRKTILQELQKKFKYVLVDEFQDTNIVQYELIRLLCPPKSKPNLTIVGDDSQAIYKFRGASVSNILNFIRDYPAAKQVTLNKNYRSPQEILDLAYRLIQNNNPDTLESKLGISKKLIANHQGRLPAVDFQILETGDLEADFIAKKIKVLSKKYSYQEFAILTRANNQIEPIIKALQRQGIPYQLLGPGILFKQTEIKDLLAYLKVLYDFEDSVSLYRVMTMNLFDIDTQDLILLLNFSKKTNLPLFQALKTYLAFLHPEVEVPEKSIYQKYLPLFKKNTQEKLYLLYTLIVNHLQLINKDTAGQILYVFLEKTGYLNRLVDYKTEKDERIALNISKFFSLLREYESTHEDASVFAVVDYLEMSLELGESPSASKIDAEKNNAVNLLTVHSAKGLEFPVVFIANLVNNRFPTNEKKEVIALPEALIKETLPEGNYHLQEERRLFYVGITRAKNQLFLTAARFYNEGKRQRKISQFIYEVVDQKYLEQQINTQKEEKEQLTIFDFKKPATDNYQLINRQPITTFSFTQLDTFSICPLQYKYHYLLKIPTPPAAAISFGTTIHNTLLKFYRQFQTNKKIGKQELLNIFREEWIPLGYSSLTHQRKRQQEGREILEKYFTTFHDAKLKIVDLEKPFKIKVAADIFLTGKIDRVNLLEKNIIEIVDYKTGKQPTEKDLKKSLQLSIYAIAANSKTLYAKNLEDISLTFHYLKDNQKISFQKNHQEINQVMEKVKETVTQIRTSNFPHKKGVYCKYCSFRMICPAWEQ